MQERTTLSLPEAARAIGITPVSMRALVQDGRCPFPLLKIGARHRVPIASFETYLKGERQTPTGQAE